MPGVINPGYHQGLLDQVLKGVQIARDVYGIKAEMDQNDRQGEAAQRAQQQFNDQQAGVVTSKELPFILKNAQVVPDGTENAIDIPKRTGPGADDIEHISILPRKENDYRPIADYVDEQGRHGTAIIDMNNPAQGPVGFLQTAKPQKEPIARLTTVTDTDGNLYNHDSISGATTPIDVGGAKFGKNGDADAKAAKEAEKVYTELGTKLENPRGNKAVQTAASNLLSADNALALAKRYQGNYNNMPSNDYALFIGELGKIATGGAATQHSQDALTANTLQSKWQAFKQQVGGNPTPAQLGSFIQNNVQYLEDLRDLSQKRVNDYKLAIYNSYKNRLPEELQQRFQAEHGDLFQGQPQQAPQPSVQAGQPGQAIAAPAEAGKPAASMHPEAQQALDWANTNRLSKDPDTAAKAQAILQRLGAK